jgi:hypothetical protein
VRGFYQIVGLKEMSALRFCVEWRSSLQANRRNAARFPTLTIKYEDLIEDPQPTIERICDFLGIRFEESLLQPTFDGADFTGFSSYSSFATQFKTIDRSSLAKWKEVLPQRDVRLIEYLLAKDMAALGYAGNAASGRSLALPLLYSVPYRLGQFVLRAPEPVRQLVRSIVGSPPNRVDQYWGSRRGQAGQSADTVAD